MLITVSRRLAGAFKAHYLLSAAASVMLAACSTSVERFAANPSDSDPVYTASVPKEQPATYVPHRVRHHINTSVASSEDTITSKPLASAPLSKPSGGYNYTTSYRAPAYKQPQLQAVQVAPPAVQAPQPLTTAEQHVAAAKPVAPIAQPEPAPVQSAAAGTVTVGPGMTLYSIAHAHGISIKTLAVSNNLKPPYSVHQGQVLHIPAGATAEAAPAETAPPASVPFKQKSVEAPKQQAAAEPVATKRAKPEHVTSVAQADSAPAAKPGLHTVASGDTLFGLGRKYHVSSRQIADANGLDASKPLKLGATLKIPAGGTAAVASAAPAKSADQNQEVVADNTDSAAAPAPATKADKKKLAPVAAQQPAKPEAPAAEQTADAGDQADGAAPAAATAPADTAAGMRWPVRGKVISGYGAKPNGLKNEGINIAVPEGTPVRAADGGVVAYAGNELKGYGNLVLIRHDNGMVTAYAHTKELFVKRGDTVKRGDVIAKSGQTGSVTSPQLHFEVRKGATALDPLTYLNSATASN